MKHQYQYANWLVDEVIASQLSIVIFEYEIFNLSVTLFSIRDIIAGAIVAGGQEQILHHQEKIATFGGEERDRAIGGLI